MLFCRLWRVRAIVTVHDGRLHRGEANPIEQWLVDNCIRKADEVIFLSRYVEKETRRRLRLRGRSHVIPHGILALPGLQKMRRYLPERPAILFLGRIVEYKGVEMLIEAVRQLPSGLFSHLTIAGQASYRISVPEADARIRLMDGWLSEEKMAQLLNEHDLLVLPYREASQSGIITLGIAAAIPMVCTRVGGLTEQLTSTEAVFVEPDAEALRQGLMSILSDPLEYRRIHDQLLKKREKAGWREAAIRHEAIFLNPPAGSDND